MLIHALSQGLPALASDTGGIPELIEDGKNGFLLPPEDVGAWHARLAQLAQNREQLTALRNYATATAGRFDPKLLMQRIIALADVPRRHDFV